MSCARRTPSLSRSSGSRSCPCRRSWARAGSVSCTRAAGRAAWQRSRCAALGGGKDTCDALGHVLSGGPTPPASHFTHCDDSLACLLVLFVLLLVHYSPPLITHQRLEGGGGEGLCWSGPVGCGVPTLRTQVLQSVHVCTSVYSPNRLPVGCLASVLAVPLQVMSQVGSPMCGWECVTGGTNPGRTGDSDGKRCLHHGCCVEAEEQPPCL